MKIVVNADEHETRIALLEKDAVTEFYIERHTELGIAGNIYKGRVIKVLPGMQAAFVDIGLEKAAFLYVGDYFESVLETGQTEGEPGSGGRRRNGRGRNGRSAPPRIDTVLQEGKEIIVQIAKEPIGTKGARITSSLSIPGRHLVLTPWSRRVGVSRRIGSDKERRRLREVVERLRSVSLAVYAAGAAYARQRGIILADTKFEFGNALDSDGRRTDEIILIDEVLTPDSSRYWPADRHEPGREQDNFDKQYVRNHLQAVVDAGKWDKTPPGPELPADVVANTSSRYVEVRDRLFR